MQVDELWDSMCQSAIKLITESLPTVESDELMLKIKGRIALFMLTMEVMLELPLTCIATDTPRKSATLLLL